MSEARKILEAVKVFKGYYINVFLWVTTKEKFSNTEETTIRKWFDTTFAKAVKESGLARYIEMGDWEADTEFNDEKNITSEYDNTASFDCCLLGKFSDLGGREEDDEEVITSEIKKMLKSSSIRKVAEIGDSKIEILYQ